MAQMDTVVRGLAKCQVMRSEEEVLMNWLSALHCYPRGHPYKTLADHVELDYTKSRDLQQRQLEDLIWLSHQRVLEHRVEQEKVFLARQPPPATDASHKVCRCCGHVGHVARVCDQRDPNGCVSCGKGGHRPEGCPHPDAVSWRAWKARTGSVGHDKTSNVVSGPDASTMPKMSSYLVEAALPVSASPLVCAFLTSSGVTKGDPGKTTTLVDSGCSRHMFGQKRFFDLSPNLKPFRIPITVGSGHTLWSEGVGDVFLNVGGVMLSLPSSLYVPGLALNLVSVSQLDKAGCGVLFAAGQAKMSCGTQMVLMARRMDSNLYEVDL